MANHEITCSWQGENFLFKAEDIHGHSLLMDTEKNVGGDNLGFRPMQLLLLGLAGCMGMSVKAVLDKSNVEVESLDINVFGELDFKRKPKIYKSILLKFFVKGKNIEKDYIEKAIAIAEEKYCSVSAILSELADIKYEIEVI